MKDATETIVYKVLKLIALLDWKKPKTVAQLEKLLEVSDNTIYRYLDILRKLGYPIEKDKEYRHFIRFVSSNKDNTLDSEEMKLIQSILQQNKSSHPNPLIASVLHKIDTNASLIPLADALPGLHRNRLLRLIDTAIEQEVCIIIKGYHSMSSPMSNDRYVEPLMITEDYRYLIAWDKNKQAQRQFKLDRIEDVDIRYDNKISSGHEPTSMDLFGLTGDNGDQWLNVKMELSRDALYFLLEEFPNAKQFIKKVKIRGKDEERIVFDGRVLNWKGIGRFVLGLMGEIKIIEPQEFKDYLNKKITNF